jgi:Cu2+-exporting ATPase
LGAFGAILGGLKEQPRTVWLWCEGVEIETPIDAVAAGDLVVVHAGEVMPVDGAPNDYGTTFGLLASSH